MPLRLRHRGADLVLERDDEDTDVAEVPLRPPAAVVHDRAPRARRPTQPLGSAPGAVVLRLP